MTSGMMFMAGYIPGILMAVALMITVNIIAKKAIKLNANASLLLIRQSIIIKTM